MHCYFNVNINCNFYCNKKESEFRTVAGQTNETIVGRPPKPKHLKRTNRIVLLFTDEEQEALDTHVAENGYADRSDFARYLILRQIGFQRAAIKSED